MPRPELILGKVQGHSIPLPSGTCLCNRCNVIVHDNKRKLLANLLARIVMRGLTEAADKQEQDQPEQQQQQPAPAAEDEQAVEQADEDKVARKAPDESSEEQLAVEHIAAVPSAAKRRRMAGEWEAEEPAEPPLPLPAQVHFPPAFLSDFVIHYRGTAYHVHKFILCYHSSYFSTYMTTLVNGQRAHPTDECDEHPAVAHCIRLPNSCGKVEASSDDFGLFLCHLYFAQHYSCVPYTVASHVDLAALPPPDVLLDYPKFNSYTDLEKATRSTLLAPEPPEVYEAVMSLGHYFDCALVLSRAEDNLLLMVAASQFGAASALEDYRQMCWSITWPCLSTAIKFDLKRVKTACMSLLATCCRHLSSQSTQWESIRTQLDKDTLFVLLQMALVDAKK